MSNDSFVLDHDFGESHQPGINPLKMVLSALQDRWHWAILLGAILGGGLGAAGYMYGTQDISFTSQGVVRVVPSRPQILYETELSQRLPEYDSYRSLQARVLQSQDVLGQALSFEPLDEIWPRLADGNYPAEKPGLRELLSMLRVSVPRNEDVLIIRVTHEDPDVAKTLVNAVLWAYMDRISINTDSEYTRLIDDLENLQKRYNDDRFEARRKMVELAGREETDNLDRRREVKNMELELLAKRLREIDVAITSVKADTAAGESENDVATDVQQTPERLAQFDQQLSQLLSRQRSLETEIQSNRDVLGREHPQMKRLARDVLIMRSLVDERADRVRDQLKDGTLSAGPVLASSRSLDVLEAQKAELETQSSILVQDLKDLAMVQIERDRLEQQAQKAEQGYLETVRRLDALRVENRDLGLRGGSEEESDSDGIEVGEAPAFNRDGEPVLDENGDQEINRFYLPKSAGRVEPILAGDTPIRPSSDNKKKFGAMGLLAGGGLGFALVALPGLIAPKYRSIGQLATPSSMYSVLGVMPELDAGGAAGDELARLNLHQIRILLESARNRSGGDSESYLFTSATSGEGKTSLVLAMSSAYANAGMSVAIVDADLVGRSLTPQLISPELDGVLQWLRKQDVTAEPPVHSTPIPGVYMVPHGRDNGLEPESLGPKHMRAMLDLLKSRFDVVLVDSGPILGSTEAAAAATVCDETVLVIGRGQRESLVKAARDRLERLGTRRVGLVFNRADREDLERHPTSAASTSMSKRSRVSGGAPQSLALSLAMQVSSDRGA